MSHQGIWAVLGIAPTQDLSLIKQAYARQLKNTRPDQDPQGYQRLREAFDAARNASPPSGRTTPLPQGLAGDTEAPDAAPEAVSPAPVVVREDPARLAFKAKARANRVALAQIPQIIDAMMDDETEGLQQLVACLASDALPTLDLREQFSQSLAKQLSEREGLYSALLIKVSGIMGWDIDHYQPGGISAQRLAALHRQIDMTGANYYWSVLAREYQDSALNRLRLRLLTVEGATLPWWARLVPDFLTSLRDKLRDIRTHYPVLLPRVNPVLLKTLSETRLALSWGTVFLTGFWLLLIMLATREHANPWPVRASLILLVGLYIHGYSFLDQKLRHKPRLWCATVSAFSVLSTAIMVKILLGFFSVFKPDAGNLAMAVTNYGVLSASSFCVLWMMAPKHWKWYGVPLNAMIILLIFPWQLMRRTRGVVGIVAFVFLLFIYALLLAFGLS